MQMPDCIRQHQTYARSETYLAPLVGFKAKFLSCFPKKKAKNLKEINICLYAFFGVLLILAIRSAFSGEKWDCAVLGLLMLILFLIFMLINLEWEVNCAGITCYILFGKIKVKTYLWSNFCYVGSLLVLGKGRTVTS